MQRGAKVRATNPDGATALHWAVFRNALPCIETLLRAGADKDAKDSNGYQVSCPPPAEFSSVGIADGGLLSQRGRLLPCCCSQALCFTPTCHGSLPCRRATLRLSGATPQPCFILC